MAYVLAALLVAVLAAASDAADHWEPMVAFVCNRGSMYYSKSGWTSDLSTDCLDNPKDILGYCQRLFPDQDVTNIVEASAELEIAGWCPLSGSCTGKEVFSVRPYRCLRGAFQSDALVVPRQCKFDYVRNSDKCRSYDWWGNVAKRACADVHSMAIQSYGMLLPCDTDMFNGVEFVCCPGDSSDVAYDDADSQEEEEEDEDDKAEWQQQEQPVVSVKASKVAAQPASRLSKGGEAKPPAAASASRAEESAASLLNRYLNMAVDKGNVNEHEAFKLTKQAVEADAESKLQNIMKEWAAAKNRVLELQAVDTKEAEKLNKEVTYRFQKEYFAQQNEGEASLRQVESVHQQHVYSILNEKKRVAVEALIRKIDDGAEPAALMKYLQRYITLEHKDAEQCLRHYLNERDRYPEDLIATDLKQDTIDHLRLISTRIRQGIDLVNGYPDDKVAAELQANVRKWIKDNFLDIDNVVRQLSDESVASRGAQGSETDAASRQPTTAEPAKPVASERSDAKPSLPKSSAADGKGSSAVALPAKPVLDKGSVPKENSRAEDAIRQPTPPPQPAGIADRKKSNAVDKVGKQSSFDYYDDGAVQLTAQQIKAAYADELKKQQDDRGDVKAYSANDGDDDDDSKEDEHAYFYKDVKAVKLHASHALKAGQSIDEQEFSVDATHRSSLRAGTAIAIAGGVMVAVAIIVGAIVVVRRKQDTGSSRRASYIEVAMDMSPEELHVMQMQMNGYENPTYRFLEMHQSSAPQQQQQQQQHKAAA